MKLIGRSEVSPEKSYEAMEVRSWQGMGGG